MANKLKKIFSNEKVTYNTNIKFTSKEAYKNFFKALETVHKEGRGVEIKGIESVETSISNGGSQYPGAKHSNVVDLFVYPSVEEVLIDVETENGKRQLILYKTITSDGMILETKKDAIVYLKMNIDTNTGKSRLSYKAYPNHASSIFEIVEMYSIVFAFFDNFFIKNESEYENLEEFQMMVDIKKYFTGSIKFYKKILFVEEKFNIQFLPNELFSDIESENNLNEIYVLLHDFQAIRLDANLSDFESNAILAQVITGEFDVKEKAVGSLAEVPFLRRVEYKLWNKKVKIYCANFLSNAKIKDIKQVDENEVKIYFTNTDSSPMFISFKGFLSEKDAEKEKSEIMEKNRDEYIGAPTLSEYIKKTSYLE